MAPLALAAAAAGTYVIVHDAIRHKHAPAPAPVVQSTPSHTRSARPAHAKAKFYVVRPNDTLSKIAARTGVPLATIEALNPSVNPDALHPAERLRLRR